MLSLILRKKRYNSKLQKCPCYLREITCGYDLVAMIVASQATHSGSNPGIRIPNKIGGTEPSQK